MKTIGHILTSGRALLCAGCLLAALTPSVWGDTCVRVSAGLDTTYGNYGYQPIFGQALMQSFAAVDTVVTAVTVWRPATDKSAIGAKIFIIGATSSGTPLSGVVYHEGPTLDIYDSTPP